jgi:hypothetical protein
MKNTFFKFVKLLAERFFFSVGSPYDEWAMTVFYPSAH